MPSNKYGALTAKLSRDQSSVIVQLRTGHVPLNIYLHRILKTDQPVCLHCKTGDETVHHYLFECLKWGHEWWLLGQSLRRASKSLASLLGSKWGVKEVLKLMGRTGRFRDLSWLHYWYGWSHLGCPTGRPGLCSPEDSYCYNLHNPHTLMLNGFLQFSGSTSTHPGHGHFIPLSCKSTPRGGQALIRIEFHIHTQVRLERH